MDSKAKAKSPEKDKKNHTMFCVHEKCKYDQRVLSKMEDMMNHTGAGHKVVDLVRLQEFVKEKFSDNTIQKIDSTLSREKQAKDEIQKIITEIKTKLDEFSEQEQKKVPSLSELSTNIRTVLAGQEISEATMKNLVNFNPEAIPKYANVLGLVTNRLVEIKQVISNLLKETPNYRDEVVALSIMRNRWTWNEQLKSTSYKIISKDLKVVEATNPFMGWSFVLMNPPVTQRALHEVEVQIDEIVNEKSQPLNKDIQLKTFNFAIGMTHLKPRAQKGYDQQDLSMVGHGFYLLRSDGWVCHNSDKEINWKKDLAFVPSIESPLLLKWNPQDHMMTIEQVKHTHIKFKGKQSYDFKVDKLVASDALHFCLHLKSAKCRILD